MNMPKGVYQHKKGYKLSEEHKRNISQAHKGMKKPWVGRDLTEESKKKISEALKNQWANGKRKNIGGWKHSEKAKKKIGLANKKRKFSKEYIEKISERLKKEYIEGLRVSPNWKGGRKIETICKQCNKKFKDWKCNERIYCSKKCYGKGKKGHFAWNKGLKGWNAGKNHWNWKGGITTEQMKIRNGLEYKIWVQRIFKKDCWICKLCGYKGKNIIAHHLKSFSEYPELRFNVKNGITLCRNCHMGIHKIDLLNAKRNTTKS